MKANNVSIEQLNQALANVNASNGYQLVWNRQPEPHGRWLHFTIRSRVSKVHGASVSHSGRNTPAASWEAHGHFFDAVAQVAPDSIIKTARATYEPGNRTWRDFSIGSMFQPMQASENAY